MNIEAPTFEQLEATLERLQTRFPDLPVGGVMVSRLLMHLGRGMSSLIDFKIRPFGLAEVEFRVLTTLYSQPDGVAHPSELCSRTSQSPANMSRISDTLVLHGFITRISSVNDRRKMVLRITAQGEGLVRRLLPTLDGLLHDLFHEVPDDERRQLIEQLKRLVAKLHDAMTRHAAERLP